MKLTKYRAIIRNNKLSIDLPKSFNNSEVEVFIQKVGDILNNKNSVDDFLNFSISIDRSIPYPNREQRNARKVLH